MLEVETFAEKLANMPTKAIGLIKRYLNKSWESDLNEVLEYEAQAQKIAGESEDHQEGLAAFLDKRKPAFTGK
jgi:2-(1,2-epoxy-1,2-dihydrophenyl)acetyl-CoA isomerase